MRSGITVSRIWKWDQVLIVDHKCSRDHSSRIAAWLGDTILSAYTSEDGQYSGSESLVFVDKETYQNRGFAFHNRNKLSSWEVDLNRKSDA